MKIKNLLLLAAAASLGMSAFAQSNGEFADFANGTPTQDHFFVRGTYNDMGSDQTMDNVLSFKAGSPQLVWIHLNDDEIYLNEAIQGLARQEVKKGTAYNETTYNSFQTDIYMPKGLEIIIYEDEDGNEISFVQGDRLPGSTNIDWAKKEGVTKYIDGEAYDVYTFAGYNASQYGSHFSAQNASKYINNGALKKDATLFGLYIVNNNQEQVEGHLKDMIIGNTLLTLFETDETFFYGTKEEGQNRYMQFNRVSVYGSSAVVENLAEKTVNNVKYYNVAGMESEIPFDGINIKVTTYNDGTTSTCKVIK